MTSVLEALELPKTNSEPIPTGVLDEAYSINEDFDSVARIQSGDMQAFEPLYARYASPITSRLVDLCMGDVFRAEDLAQDTFVKALTRIDKLKDVSNGAGPWLFTIARNTFYDSFRLNKYRSSGEVSADTLPHLADSVDEESIINGLMAKAELRQIFKVLPATFADCLVASVEGYSGEEIATMLGIEKATVRTRTFRARKRAMQIHQKSKA